MLQRLREFLRLGSLATVAAVVGIGSGIYSIANSGGHGGGGGSGGAPGATGYVPGWQGGADNMWQQIMQQMGGASGASASNLMPFLMQALQSGEAGMPGAQARMNHFGDTMTGTAGTFFDAQHGLEAAGGELWKTAQDPQNALHDRTQQQITDASRASSSARGIGMSGESAGLENQAVSNFNIDWQNNELSRMLEGMKGLTGAYDSAGRQGQAGDAALVGASDMYTGAMGLPFGLANSFGGAMNSSVYSPWQALSGNLAQYMGLGQSGGQNAFNQQQTGLNNFTSGLSSLSQQPWMQNYFGPPASTGSGASTTVDDTTWGGA